MKNRWSFLKVTSAVMLSPMLIVRNPDEGETYVRETTPITIKVSKQTDGIDSVSICTEEIPLSSGIPVHKHLDNDEIFFFHKGSGTFMLDNQELAVNEGSTAFIPKGVWHGLKNTGSDLLVFTFSFSPAGFEDFFRQIGTLKGTPFKEKTEEEKKLLAKKYGMVFK